MFDGAALLSALAQVVNPINLLLMVAGVGLGIIVGVSPGLGAPLGIAIALPFTFYISPQASFSVLLGIYSGAIYGGSISAVVLGIPGTPPAAATVLDGHPLFRKGEGSKALTLSLIGSVFGGIFSTLVLALTAPVLASFALRFGPAEYFVLGVVGVSVVGRISGDNAVKGIFMGALGVFLTTFGIDPVNGNTRYIFGMFQLYSGIPFIPFLVGLFAIPEMLLKAQDPSQPVLSEGNLRIKMPRFVEILKYKATLLRSAVIGTIAGIIPGQGGAIGAFLSYAEAKRASKEPEQFGKGHPDGVLAAETSNNATVGGALVPTLTLGVPGSAAAAVLLGALTIQGLDPGPRLFAEAPVLVYFIFVALVVINIVLFFLGWVSIISAQRIVRIPDRLLIPVVLAISLVGSYATVGTMFGVVIALVFGVFGYIVRKLGFPVTPLVLGFVLGPMIEVNFRNALTISNGSLLTFVTRPIAIALWILMIGALAGPAITAATKKRKKEMSEE